MKKYILLVMTLIGFCFSMKSYALAAEKPTISLMVWDETAKEGSKSAEFILYQVGKFKPGLTVHFKTSGTAKNGYDYRIRDDIKMRGSEASLTIKPVEDLVVTGNKTVTITLLPDSAYTIDPKNATKTIIIQDAEMPVVQFLLPCSNWPESSKGEVQLTLSKVVSHDVKIDYAVSGVLAKNGVDFDLPTGSLVIPAGTAKISMPLNVVNNNVAEDDKTIIIRLTNATNANIGLNKKHYYTVTNDDGDVPRSPIYDKIYGIILGSRSGSSLGMIDEWVGQLEDVEKLYGVLTEFIPCNHYDIFWSHPAGGTEDGIERQKCISTAIIEKQDRITAEDLMKTWIKDFTMEDMNFMTQPYDRILLAYTKWGVPAEELPNTKYGMPYDLGDHIHLTARVFHPIPAINAGDPESAIRDTKEIGRIYYENKNDDAFTWGGVYNAALTLAMLPGATVNSVIEGALKYATPEMRTEIEHGLAIADKYTDPMDRNFRVELNAMYADTLSPYCASKRMTKYIGSSIYENVTCSFAIFKLTKGNVKQAVIIATNRGRDTDCTSASAGAMAGALTGTTTIPKEWVDQLEVGMKNTPYTNSFMTNKATSQALYRAFQNKLKRMTKELKISENQYGKNLPQEDAKKKKYLNLMHEIGVI